MEFEWDANKAASNLSKHGVSFDEAQTVFDDTFYVDFYDPDHSYDEHRYIIIGQSAQNHLFIDCVIYRTRQCNSFNQREKSNAQGERNV